MVSGPEFQSTPCVFQVTATGAPGPELYSGVTVAGSWAGIPAMVLTTTGSKPESVVSWNDHAWLAPPFEE